MQHQCNRFLLLQNPHTMYTIYRMSPGKRRDMCKLNGSICAKSLENRIIYQLSESTSLFASSSVFSVEMLEDLFHFGEFSGSSEEDLFCLLHLALRFLNHTYNKIKIGTLYWVIGSNKCSVYRYAHVYIATFVEHQTNIGLFMDIIVRA